MAKVKEELRNAENNIKTSNIKNRKVYSSWDIISPRYQVENPALRPFDKLRVLSGVEAQAQGG
ncbi:MAG: hypothetical protein KAW52_03535, partial [candidate division Zixibacteria bacterium]|nr:hypothetical protein [candidate division Zixibacteria bacterium]